MFWLWLTEAFALLPNSNDALLRELLKRLKFSGQLVDYLDKYNAQLLCAALNQREHLFIALPDRKPRRPAFLFATALIRHWYDSQVQKMSCTSQTHHQRVLYFGATVGIRTQLQQIIIEARDDLNLADVFRQQHLGRKSRKAQTGLLNSTLPEVLTIYAPVDPIAIIEQYQPQWIAIDCADIDKLSWLHALLQCAVQHNISVIAWGQNPLSECITDFRKVGQVFIWPPCKEAQFFQTFGNTTQYDKLKSILHHSTNTQIHPIVLAGKAVDKLASTLSEANRLLARCSQHVSGRLAKDTLKLHWQYLRALESLSVPLDFYEAEAHQFWGLKSFGQLSNECEQFKKACYQHYPELAAKIEAVSALLETALNHIKTSGSPLWNALHNLSIEEHFSNQARLITFPNRARKKLFLLALLARYNITEEELRTHHTWVVNLDELRQLMRQTQPVDNVANPLSLDTRLSWHPILVGLPNSLIIPKLLPILLQEQIEVLLYPYQSKTLARQVDKWTQRLDCDLLNISTVLSKLSNKPVPQEFPWVPARLMLTELIGLEVESATKTKYVALKPLWEAVDTVSEVAHLLESEQEMGEYETDSTISFQEKDETTSRQASWYENVVEVYFEADWYACFAPDETINVIVSGSSSTAQDIDKRYVRSLKINDRVLAMPGQRRQNLYDLIICRVHGHPAIELHIALIRRWQDDFLAAYQRWQKHGVRNLEELIKQMQKRGSILSTASTLRQWLWGNILCPDDAEDLRRLAELLEMDFVGTYYLKIYQAAKRLRGLHRGLSRRLNRWLEQQATGLIDKSDDDLIDSELNLTFGDFRNSLLILRVKSVQNMTGLFLRDSLGKFERQSTT